jgi:replicative DNA helicase
MQGGEVIVVSGATGHGKTTFANQVFRNVFKKYGFVLYVSLEQPQKQDMHLNMARITKEYVLKIQRGYYDEQLYGRILTDGVGQIRQERVYRYFPTNRTLPNIYAAARRVQANVGLELVVIDYIQLLDNMRGVGSNMLEERMSNISRNIKYMAMDLNVPILALSRMTRDTNNEDINRLYGSGSIEYDADWVIFIKGDIEKNKGTLTVAKHRMGGMKGKFALSYSWETQEYSEDKTGGTVCE